MRAILGLLIVMAMILAYWKFVLGVVVAFAIVRSMPTIFRSIQAHLARRASQRAELRKRLDDLIKRADQQHAWACQGDERGIYGEYTPESWT